MTAGLPGRSARIDLSRPVPDLWPQFIALGQVPAFVLRGANSDVLSSETLEAMTERHPNLRAMTVPGPRACAGPQGAGNGGGDRRLCSAAND